MTDFQTEKKGKCFPPRQQAIVCPWLGLYDRGPDKPILRKFPVGAYAKAFFPSSVIFLHENEMQVGLEQRGRTRHYKNMVPKKNTLPPGVGVGNGGLGQGGGGEVLDASSPASRGQKTAG